MLAQLKFSGTHPQEPTVVSPTSSLAETPLVLSTQNKIRIAMMSGTDKNYLFTLKLN
jgi:hypothetical protein